MSPLGKSVNGEPLGNPEGRNYFYSSLDRWVFLKSKLFFFSFFLTIGLSTSIKIYSTKKYDLDYMNSAII